MKKRPYISALLLTSMFLLSGVVTVRGQAPSVISAWLVNPVTIDGQVTSSDEWAESTPVDVTIGLIRGSEPPFYNVRIWAKNDKEYLYLLYRITYPSEEADNGNGAGISYFWPSYDPVTGWPYSDSSWSGLGGPYVAQTYDYYGWNGTRWKRDIEASPPGQNNVEGGGKYDDTYYWFELKKPLNSGDGYDLNLKLDETYGTAEDSMLIEFYDNKEGQVYSAPIGLTIADKPPAGLPLIPIGIGIGGAAAIAAVVLLMKKRKKPEEKVPKPAALKITADPAELLADGKSTSTITIELLDEEGKPIQAPEDTEVRLSTNLGRIASPVTIRKDEATGKAILISSTEFGEVKVTAESTGLSQASTSLSFMEKKRYCMHCGTKMPMDSSVCPKCGRAPPSGVDVKVCQNCSEVIPTVAKFCSNCGAGQAEKKESS